MQAVIIAPNREERDFLSYVLRQVGLSVARTAETKRVTSSLLSQPIDLILLVPGKDTVVLEDVKAIRSVSQAPLFLISDALTEDDYCDLMDAGVDLVMTRPLSARLLVRYVRVFLHRVTSVPVFLLSPIDAEGISLYPDTRRVVIAGQEPQQLTPLEFRLLYVLMTHADQVVPLDMIIERVWGYDGDGNRELVRGLVRRLRRKIEPSSDTPCFIHNHPGIGYRFSPQAP
jgi:DNA-binding response OmpR family regulator